MHMVATRTLAARALVGRAGRSPPGFWGSPSGCAVPRRSLSTPTNEVADQCNLHVETSPYAPIEGPFPPIYEFVSSTWEAHGGTLGDKVAILDGATGLTRTFHEYHSATTNIAASLRYELGVDENGTVALYSPNHVDYVPISLAVSLCGAKLTPANPLYKAQELSVILNRSQSSVLIAHKALLETALESARGSPSIKHVIVITDDDTESVPEGTIRLADLKHHGKRFEETSRTVHGNVETHPVLLPYSSGTTGLPKGVCLTHKNLVANLKQLVTVEDLGFPRDHKLYSPLPFFHIYGFLVSALGCAWKGQQVITTSGRFDMEQFCQLVEEHRPERAHLVPPIILGLAKHPAVEKYDMSSLQFIVSGAAPLGSEVETAARKRLGCGIKQAWGMSELSPVGLLNSDFDAKVGSAGPLVSSTEGKVIDENGKSLPPNSSGELLIRGPQVMLGYLDDPEKTAECLSDSGWLRTGDVAYYDDDGYFYITDRVKELIKVRGYQVAPAELEALLLTNEHIQDAAVIQIKDEASGELPCAFVVLKEDETSQKLNDRDIYDWVKERVAPYKRLDGGVVFTTSIPKSASGKILRRMLRDQVAAETKETPPK